MNKELKVTNVRYFETRRGLGYECKTNIKGLLIWNDGNGGGTYLDCEPPLNGRDLVEFENKYKEIELEKLIDIYEGININYE
jgi:hypothetical protein